jgi:hypothetical protein
MSRAVKFFWMIAAPGFFFALAVFFAGPALSAEEGIIEVTARGRGATEDEAVAAALDEAVRGSLGSIFAERSELGGETLEDRLIEFSRGSAVNYKIVEKSTDEYGVVVTALVAIDSRKMRENARTVKEGHGGGGVSRWESPLLDGGAKKISGALREFRYEDYMNAALNEKLSDPRSGRLELSVTLSFDAGRFYRDFAGPVGEALDGIFRSPGLRAEIDGEFQEAEDRHYISFELLGENFSSKNWTLPRNFYDALKRPVGFWVASEGRIATHKRMWLHFSLLDDSGREIERLPIHLPFSNVIFFSEIRKQSPNPWFYMGLGGGEQKDYAVVRAAPFFGRLSKNGYAFFDSADERFEFTLPRELLSRVAGVNVSVEFER